MATGRNNLLSTAFAMMSLIVLHYAADAADTSPSSWSRAALSHLLDRYVAAVNAHDTNAFATIFTDGYIQHSGRSPSGLAAQIANFQHIVETWPDIQMRIEDRVIDADKIAARVTFTATHSNTVLGIAPTGRKVSFGTFDIWRIDDGKLAEHWDLVDSGGLLKQLRGE